ncbi:MAG: MerR family transcriptional regulator [Acidimicrobiales bacterium]
MVNPARTDGGSRRYSEADIDLLRRILELTDEGLNLAGVKRVLQLERELAQTRQQLESLAAANEQQLQEAHRQYRRDLVPVTQAVTLYQKRRR